MSRFFAAVVVLVLAIGAFVVFRSATLQSASPSPAPKQQVASTPVPVSKEAAQSFDQKVGAVATAEARGSGQPVHLVLSEQEVASKIQQSLASRGVQDLTNVSVKLADGQATLSGTANMSGVSVPVDAAVRLGADKGLMTVEITSIKAAGVGLPDSLQQQLIDQVRRATGLNDLQNIDLGINVQRVQVASGQLLIDGQTR